MAVTIHFCDEELDHGPTHCASGLPGLSNDTVGVLTARVLFSRTRKTLPPLWWSAGNNQWIALSERVLVTFARRQ